MFPFSYLISDYTMFLMRRGTENGEVNLSSAAVPYPQRCLSIPYLAFSSWLKLAFFLFCSLLCFFHWLWFLFLWYRSYSSSFQHQKRMSTYVSAKWARSGGLGKVVAASSIGENWRHLSVMCRYIHTSACWHWRGLWQSLYCSLRRHNIQIIMYFIDILSCTICAQQ